MEIVQGMFGGTVPQDALSKNDGHAPASDAAVYKYYIGVAGRRKFMVFLGLCAIFVVGITFNR
jgi:hypothetical protein